MKNTIRAVLIFSILLLAISPTAFGLQQANNLYVETKSPKNVQNTQATFDANISEAIPYNTQAWFQWGTTTDYGNQTPLVSLNVSALEFSHTIYGLTPNTTYHYRIVGQSGTKTVYGQDMAFTTGGVGTGSLVVTKKAINLTARNFNWQSNISANPLDTVSFAITLQAVGADVQNVTVKDALPQGLIYKGNSTIDASLNYQGDITSGITLGTISSGHTVVISYQAQVALAENFVFGTASLENISTITASNAGTQTASSSVLVTRSLIQGASTIATGLTNNFWGDSFFVPLFLIIAGLWMYFSGKAYKIADWIKIRK